MMHIVKLIFLLLFMGLPAMAFAGEEEPCDNCGSPQEYRQVSCPLVSLHFTQETEGAVAIRFYDAKGKVIYGRYSKERAFVKQTVDKYSVCESVAKNAVRVTITRCIPEIATPRTAEGNILQVLLDSKKNPVALP